MSRGLAGLRWGKVTERCASAIDILRLLQAGTLDILAMVKELKRLAKGQASGVEHMDGGDMGGENSSDSEDN